MLLSLAVGKFPFSIIGSDLIHTLGYHAVIMVMFTNILQTCSRSSSWSENVTDHIERYILPVATL